MKIELTEITVEKLTDGFADNAEQGVVAYGGNLDIRPPYQREFIYKDKQRPAMKCDCIISGLILYHLCDAHTGLMREVRDRCATVADESAADHDEDTPGGWCAANAARHAARKIRAIQV